MDNRIGTSNGNTCAARPLKSINQDPATLLASPKFTRKRNPDLHTVTSPRRISDNKTEIGEKFCYISPKKNLLECANGGCESALSLASMPVGRVVRQHKNSVENLNANPTSAHKQSNSVIPTSSKKTPTQNENTLNPAQQQFQNSDQKNLLNISNRGKRTQRRSMKTGREQFIHYGLGRADEAESGYQNEQSFSEYYEYYEDRGSENFREPNDDEVFNNSRRSALFSQHSASLNNLHQNVPFPDILNMNKRKGAQCPIEPTRHGTQLLQDTLKQNQSLKIEVEKFRKSVRQWEDKFQMLKEENNYMYRTIEEYSAAVREKEQQLRQVDKSIAMKEEELCYLRVKLEETESTICRLYAKIEEVAKERDFYADRDRENAARVSQLLLKSNRNESQQFLMVKHPAFSDETTTIGCCHEEDEDLESCWHRGSAFCKAENIDALSQAEQEIRRYKETIAAEIRYKELQDFIITSLRYNLKIETEKTQRAKTANKKLLHKIEALTQAQKNKPSKKIAVASEKNNLSNRFDVTFGRKYEEYRPRRSRSNDDDEISLELSPEKN